MISFPNCKINLGLNITGKREDGFHDLQTLFYPVQWCDALEFVPAEAFQFENSGLVIQGAADDNLCVKAYHLLKKEFDLPPLHFHLHKTIPMGAGLGGGSADAAFSLKMLNRNFRLGLTDEQLQQYAAQLGSDCAFFIKNMPAFAEGRGEVLEEINLDLSGYYIAIAYPELHINTGWAFQELTPAAPKFLLRKLPEIDMQDWKEILVNDFEKVVFKQFPQIKELKDKLYHQGAVFAAMSGSGSAVFGIFSTEPDKVELVKQLGVKPQYCFVGKMEL